MGFIEQWDDLLGQMNAGKRGRPFRCPEPFIAWMACIHVFLQMPYRQMEGFVWTLATFIPSLRAANYTTLFRRIQRRDLSLTVKPEILAEFGYNAEGAWLPQVNIALLSTATAPGMRRGSLSLITSSTTSSPFMPGNTKSMV